MYINNDYGFCFKRLLVLESKLYDDVWCFLVLLFGIIMIIMKLLFEWIIENIEIKYWKKIILCVYIFFLFMRVNEVNVIIYG